MDNQNSENQQNDKEVEFYAANLNAWLNTRFEYDKSLLSLSAGGIGILITFLSNSAAKSIYGLIFYFFAITSFMICLGALLWVFRRNAKHLEDVVKNINTSDSLLKCLDNIALISFIVGVISASFIGFSTVVTTYYEKEQEKMTKPQESSVKPTTQSADSGKFSIDGVANMRPKPPEPTSQLPSQSSTNTSEPRQR